MDFEKYTERARGFVQSAQGLALRSGHQRFAPEHLLKVLLDDPEGLAANLMTAAADVIRERGFDAATMAEIAERAGAKIGSLYRFFPNKDALADALDRITSDAELRAKLSAAGPVRARPFTWQRTAEKTLAALLGD